MPPPRRLVLLPMAMLLGLAGAAGAAPPTAGAAPPPTPGAPTAKRASDAILARRAVRDLRSFRTRVHVVRTGAVGLDPDHLVDSSDGHMVPLWDEQVVVGERRDTIRIAVDDDDARLLLWIPRADVAWTVARPTRIVGRGATGVWMLPGAPLLIRGDGRRVEASYADANFTIDGTIARSALAHVFPATRARRGGTHATAGLWREPDGAALVSTAYGLGVSILDRGPGDWRLVEHTGRYVRAVGWTRAGALHPGEIGLGGIGGGSGYGMSHTQRIEVPAGTCMFDDRGALVGVQIRTAERYANGPIGGRWNVYVGNAWGLRTVVIRDVSSGNVPKWQSCR